MKKRIALGLVLSVSIFILAFAGIATAAVVYVDQNTAPLRKGVPDGTSWKMAFHTVQEGIDAAVAGDEVWIAKGTYYGTLLLKGEIGLYGGFTSGMTSRSQRNWKTNETILDGNKAGSVITVATGATIATRIDGFTIRNGLGTKVDLGPYFGGGILCRVSSATITNNLFTGNGIVEGTGGGIMCDSSNAVIFNNTFIGNLSYQGNAIGMQTSSPIIYNNLIVVTSYGDAIYVYAWSNPVISNNTIIGAATQYGIQCYWECSPVISNNIITNFLYGIAVYYGNSVPIRLNHNNVYGNLYSDYRYIDPRVPESGDISVDPLFVDNTTGNYHLKAGSPCINAGDTSVVDNTWIDIDRQGRVNYSDNVGIVDIGADEYYPDAFPPFVTATDPVDGASGVLLSQILTFTFNEAIDVVPPDSNIVLYNVDLGQIVGTTASTAGNILTITPSALNRKTTYSVTIPAFSVRDMAGNGMVTDKVIFFATGSR